MDTKFQTSFIPKKPLTVPLSSPSRGGTSIFMTLSVLLFILSLAGAGFAIGWQKYLINQQEAYKKILVENQKQFQPQLIETLSKANAKIDLAKQLIKNHLAVSEIFDILSRLTIENVKFDSFDFAAPTATDGVKVTMHGVGASFSAIAFQSDVFGQSAQYGKNKILKNPVLSDLSLDQNGNVAFSFSATLNPDDLSYAKIYAASLKQDGAAASSDGSANSAAADTSTSNSQ